MKFKKKGFVVTLSNEELSSNSDCENFGKALINCITEVTEEELSFVFGKKEAKVTSLEVEEVLFMWEED